MANYSELRTSSDSQSDSPAPAGWMKFGLIAMASAVLGGMATAWWYRKTLIRLRQAEDTTQNPQIGISEEDFGDGI
jgi:hypothetical protein